MQIVVCIKAVKSELLGSTIDRSETYSINPYDLYALEQCLLLKKQNPDCHIMVLCMGSMECERLLRQVLAMGADDTALISDPGMAGSDTLATSYILSKAITHCGQVDVVACGKKTVDGETGQVVYGITERLRYHFLENVRTLSEYTDKELLLERSKECNIEKVKLHLPAVISFENFTLKQPFVSLVARKKAKTANIPVWNLQSLSCDETKCGLDGSRTKVIYADKRIKKKEKHSMCNSKEAQLSTIVSLLMEEGI